MITEEAMRMKVEVNMGLAALLRTADSLKGDNVDDDKVADILIKAVIQIQQAVENLK